MRPNKRPTPAPRLARARRCPAVTAAPIPSIQSLEDLTVDPHNANCGTPRGQEALARSLREYGTGRAVLIDRHGRIIAGNKTVEQAKRPKLPMGVLITHGVCSDPGCFTTAGRCQADLLPADCR